MDDKNEVLKLAKCQMYWKPPRANSKKQTIKWEVAYTLVYIYIIYKDRITYIPPHKVEFLGRA